MSENISIKVVKWLKLYGGSPWRFTEMMMHNLDIWKDLEIENVYEIIRLSKGCSICFYSFVPFFVKYLGIDLRSVIKKVAASEKWEPIYVNEVLQMFPDEFKEMHKETTLEKMGFVHLKSDLKRIRDKFKRDDVVKIKMLNIVGYGEISRIYFDK